jgi:dipeptidyl aminopeptidase/acylaminoacyl peptidase
MDPVPTEAFYDLSAVTDVALSPDGDRAAFVAAESDATADERVASLFVVPTDGSRDPHRLTRVSSASDPAWSPDGDRLAFLAAREEDVERRVGRDEAAADETDADEEADATEAAAEETAPDDEPKTQVWCFDLARGGDARQVTAREEGVAEFDWAPEGDRLVVAARDPDEDEREYLEDVRDGGPIETERFQHKMDGEGYLDTVTTYLFVVDVETGAADRLDEAYGGGAVQSLTGMSPAWGSDGRIAFTSCRTERPDATFVRDAYTIRPDGSDLRRHTDERLTVRDVRFDPAGDRLAFTARDPEKMYVPAQMYLTDVAADADDYRSLSASLDRTLSWFAEPLWVDDETLYTLVGDEGRTRPVRLSPEDDPVRTLPALGDDRTCPLFDVASGTALAVLSHPSEGRDLYAFDEEAADDPDLDLGRLTDRNADLREAYALPQVRRVTYESDGHDVEGLVYAPPSFDFEASDPAPTVVSIHGGPVSYDEPEFDFAHAVFTSRGYLVFCPNYRGGSSYGEAFAEELWGQWGTAEVEDVIAGARELVARGWADEDRLFGGGFSYGGIAQGYLVTQHPDLFAAAAPEHGIYDLSASYGTDDSHVWVENEFGLPWENPEAFEAASSITDVGDLRTPLLVVAGGEDWRCPPSQSEQLYVSAKAQEVAAKLVVYPDEHHNIGDPDRATHRLDQILSWYDRHDPATDGDGGDDD